MTSLWKAGGLVTPCGSLRSLALFQLFFHITPLCMVIGTFAQQMEKGKNLPQGRWRDQDAGSGRIQTWTHTSQLPDTRNQRESKHQIWDFNNMSIYFNDLKAEPAGLVTVSKRYGERNDEAWIFILTATTGELWICAHSGLRQGRICVPCAHTITQDRQPPAGQQVSSEHWASLQQFQIHWEGYYSQIILRHISFLAITILQRRLTLREEQSWEVCLMVKSRELCHKKKLFLSHTPS